MKRSRSQRPLLALIGAVVALVATSDAAHAATIAAGPTHACAIVTPASVTCWGANDEGQLGAGSFSTSFVPPGAKSESQAAHLATRVLAIDDAIAVSAGNAFSCALHAGGTVSCWGKNDEGQLGNGSRVRSATPVVVPNVSGATALSVGDGGTCVLLAGGTVSCWGVDRSSVPAPVVGLTDARILDGDCAIRAAGPLTCWNAAGELREIPELAGSSAISGPSPRCALSDARRVSCWRLGAPELVPGIDDAVAISTSFTHSCAIRSSGSVACWGLNRGQLGLEPDDATVSEPRTIAGIDDVVEIAAGNSYNCARLRSRAVSCWGLGTSGQLGNGWGHPSDPGWGGAAFGEEGSVKPVRVLGLAGNAANKVVVRTDRALIIRGLPIRRTVCASCALDPDVTVTDGKKTVSAQTVGMQFDAARRDMVMAQIPLPRAMRDARVLKIVVEGAGFRRTSKRVGGRTE